MWGDFLAAVALLLILEGLMPFLNPAGVKQALSVIIQMDDRVFRITGFLSMIAGLVLLYWVRA